LKLTLDPVLRKEVKLNRIKMEFTVYLKDSYTGMVTHITWYYQQKLSRSSERNHKDDIKTVFCEEFALTLSISKHAVSWNSVWYK